MSCVAEVHVGDIGTVFRITLKDKQCDGTMVILDVSAASKLDIIFRAPNGIKKTKSANFTTDGSDGKIEYISLDGDIDSAGEWKIQVYLELPSGKWSSDIGSFYVYENL